MLGERAGTIGTFTYRQLLEAEIEEADDAGDVATLEEKEAELYRHPCPPGALYVWRMFLDLHRRRQRDQGEALPVTWTETERYARLHRIQLSDLEITLLDACEAVYLEYRAEQQQKDEDDDDAPIPLQSPDEADDEQRALALLDADDDDDDDEDDLIDA